MKKDKKCYFQGCNKKGSTKEHIPPKSFFPEDERNQLLTVKSCEKHNNSKSHDDQYVLAHICLNSSPNNRSREIFFNNVVPQLSFNDNAMRKMLLKDSIPDPSGAVKYKVDIKRIDGFFDALSCGIIFKSCGQSLPKDYKLVHIFHNFIDESEPIEEKNYKQGLLDFYSNKKPLEFLKFGNIKNSNQNVYAVCLFGLPDFQGSITIVHDFFGIFKVTSMVSKIWPQSMVS